MTYLSDRAKSKKRDQKIFAVFIFLLLMIFFWRPVQSFLYPVFEPLAFVYSGSKQAISFIPHRLSSYFYDRSYYDEKVLSLENNIESLENQIVLKDSQIEDYKDKLKEKGYDGKVVLIARPLFLDFSGMYNTVILSKGFKDGVSLNSVVYLRGRQPVGVISKIHDKTSEVSFFSASGSSVEGRLKGDEVIILNGLGGGNFLADLSKKSSVNIGDVVLYNRDPSMKLGEVVDVKNDPQDVFLRVYVKGYYSPLSATNFYIDK